MIADLKPVPSRAGLKVERAMLSASRSTVYGAETTLDEIRNLNFFG